jgi:hypothetical protein
MAQHKHHPKSEAAAKQTAAQPAAATASAGNRQQSQGITEGQRHGMIAEAAYYLAEQRGFQGDMALNDWLQAEAGVSARFAAKH